MTTLTLYGQTTQVTVEVTEEVEARELSASMNVLGETYSLNKRLVGGWETTWYGMGMITKWEKGGCQGKYLTRGIVEDLWDEAISKLYDSDIINLANKTKEYELSFY